MCLQREPCLYVSTVVNTLPTVCYGAGANGGETVMQKRQPLDRPEVRVRPSGYQPTKAELEADMAIDATPEALAEATLRPVTLRPLDK